MNEEIGILIYMITFVLWTVGLYLAFEKAGEKGWKAIVPFYNIYITSKIGKVEPLFWIYICISGFYILLAASSNTQELGDIGSVITFIILVIFFFINYNFAREYDWGVFQSIILGIFYPIGIMILGAGNSVYITSKKGNQYAGRKIGTELTGRNVGNSRVTRSRREKKDMNEGYKKCPYCGEEIKEGAKKCRYCGEFFN